MESLSILRQMGPQPSLCVSLCLYLWIHHVPFDILSRSSLGNMFGLCRCPGGSEDHTRLFPVWLHCLWQDGHLFERRGNVSHFNCHQTERDLWWRFAIFHWLSLSCSYVLTLITDGMRSVRAFHFDKAAASVLTTCVSAAILKTQDAFVKGTVPLKIFLHCSAIYPLVCLLFLFNGTR